MCLIPTICWSAGKTKSTLINSRATWKGSCLYQNEGWMKKSNFNQESDAFYHGTSSWLSASKFWNQPMSNPSRLRLHSMVHWPPSAKTISQVTWSPGHEWSDFLLANYSWRNEETKFFFISIFVVFLCWNFTRNKGYMMYIYIYTYIHWYLWGSVYWQMMGTESLTRPSLPT